MLQKLKDWFSPQRRQSIQVFAGSLAPLAILFGFGNAGIWEQWLVIFGAALVFGSSLLSLLNVSRGSWGQGWAIVRGAIYGLAMTVSPALVVLGYYDDETSNAVLLAVSLSLGALSNLVAILTGKQQQFESDDRFVGGGTRLW